MDKLNYVIDECIKDFEIQEMNEFLFQEKCSSIILSHPIQFEEPEHQVKYSFDQNFEMSYKFLTSISKDYAELLIKRRNEGAFIVDYGKDPINATSISYLSNGEPIIYIIFKDNISCSYSITHEFIHDTTLLGSEESVTRNIFCEVPSIYMEFLEDTYLEHLGHVDSHIQQRCRCNIIQSKALCMAFELNLIEKTLEKGYVDKKDLNIILRKFNYNQELFEHCRIMKEQGQMFWYQDQRHVWGYLIAAYMQQREQLNPTNYKEFLEINGKLNQIDENEFLTSLDLERTEDHNIFDLKEQSYQKLKTSYVNHLKSIR